MDSTLPLTHHQILSLVQPFVRRGVAIDLAASDRVAQRLRFKPVVHPASEAMPAAVETLTLEPAPPTARRGAWRLTRRLRTLLTDRSAPGIELEAELELEGVVVAALLDKVLAVPPKAHFRRVAGLWVVLSYRLPQEPSAPATASPRPALVLRSATAPVAGLTLRLKVSSVAGYRAELELLRGAGDALALPDDLLAVLGRPWTPLTAVGRGWLGGIALRGGEPQRSREAEAHLLRTVEHLARTLAEPPARFHTRHRRARWRLALQALVPLAVGLAVLGFAWLMQGRGPGYDSMLGALANLAPPIMLGLLFLRPEMPRLALPRIPRPPRDDAWQPLRPPG